MRKHFLFSIGIIFLIFSTIYLNYFPPINISQSRINCSQQLDAPLVSASFGYQRLDEIFDTKADLYENEGYFLQLYEPSLQATYYGLFILGALEKLDIINEVEIISYIMSHYNDSTGLFIDGYAARYLATDFNYAYYPLSSLLEVNCYALLSLSLLERLDLVDISKSVDFLWSCYNPISSGFIGQPYYSNLEENFKISTMDNTYFAIKTLELLMGSWSSYGSQQDELITYINTLQNLNEGSWQYGGFYNDDSSLFNSLDKLFEPNLLSSYYCLKSLQIFGMESSINIDAFNQFLDSLYNPVHHYFRISQLDFTNFTNVVATAIGLDLSQITKYPSINQEGVISFLNSSRNSKGLWDGSTSIKKYELIDTYQVLRALYDVEEVDIHTIIDVKQLADNLLALFSNSEAFFLIPKEYNTLDLTYTMIKSYDLFDRISNLNLQALYSRIRESYFYDDYFLYDGFISYISKIEDNSFIGFRSYPIEFYTAGNKEFFDNLGYLISHKATYQALDSLKRMYKLDDFALIKDLSQLLANIVDTQFLDTNYPDQNGGFLPIMEYNPVRAEMQSKDVFLEYSFYAIKSMELLAEYLNIGDITFIGFDIDQFQSYILNQVVETSELLYFQPNHSENTETILQNTYYMIYILKILHLYNLNSKKIENFIELNIDYTDIKNVYYCYKIIEILGLDYEFTNEVVQELIFDLYITSSHEFYQTTNHNIINQEILLWICEMVINDPLQIITEYDEEVALGTPLSISASLSNIIFTEFDFNLSFKLESAQLGDQIMEREDNNKFILKLLIPASSTNYPKIEGRIVAYDNTQQLAEKSIIVHTYYNQQYYRYDVNTAMLLSALFLCIPGGFIIISGKKIKRLT